MNDASAAIQSGDSTAWKRYEEDYRRILDLSKKQNKEGLFVLCEPFIQPAGRIKDNWKKWTDEIKKYQEVTRHLAKEYDAVYVELQSIFDKVSEKPSSDYWIWDGIHPTVAVHELITRAWLKKVSNRLEFLKKYAA